MALQDRIGSHSKPMMDTADSNTAQVTVTVGQAPSPPPVAESQSITTTAGTPTDITLKATDPDGNALTYAIASDPESGEISEFDEDTGKLVYTPADGFTGQDRFTFKANDGSADSNTAQVTVTVGQAPSPPPVAESQSITTTSGTPTDITLKATDPDGNALTYAIASDPESGGAITKFNKDTGKLVYTPADGFTGQDRFTFKANDGIADSNTAQVTVTVGQAPSPPPVAESQSITTTSGTPTDITLKATDPDGNALTYAIASDPESGEISEFDEDTGKLVYTPADGFTGQDRFTFKANDGSADSNTAQVTVTVGQAPSPPPVAESQSITTTSGTPTDITLKATDPDGNALTYAIASDPESGEISEFDEDTGKLVYTPADGFTGQDRFTFKANDGSADSNTGNIRMTINDNQDATPEDGSDANLQETPATSENTTSENTTSENTTSENTTSEND